MNAVVSRPSVCTISACVFAVLVSMSAAISAAECAPSAIGVRDQCEHTPIVGIHAPVLADPYPLLAAGWGPELGKGLMASQWAENWTSVDAAARAPSLKGISLGEESTFTLSAEARLRYVTFENQQLWRERDVQQAQFRGIIGADFRVSAGLRFYGEFGTGQLDGGRHAATANFQNALSLQQLFVDALRQSGPFLIGMMAGRQEFADGPRQLLSLSDGPNLHRSWNGVRLYAHASRYRFGAFDLRATRLGRDGFDEGIASSERLSGVNASFIVSPGQSPNIYLDPFWIHSENPALRLGAVAGADDRNTVGVRLWGRRGKLRFDWTVGSPGIPSTSAELMPGEFLRSRAWRFPHPDGSRN